MSEPGQDPPGYAEDVLRRFFEELVPFNAWLGIRVESVERGRCVICLAPRPELVGNPAVPALHGGVLSAVADAAGGLAVFSALAVGHSVSTVDLRVDYLRPGKVDQLLMASGAVVRLGNRVAVANCDLWQGDPTQPIAQARGVYNVYRAGIGAR